MTLRDIQRVVFNLILGPLFGGVLFFIAAAIYEVAVGHAPVASTLASFDPRSLLGLIGFTYFVSLLPALLNGIITSLVAHWTTNRAWRVVAALVSGALWSGLMIGWVVATGDTAIAPPVIFTTLAVILGGITSLAVYLLFERLFRRPHHHPAATAGG